MKIAFLPILGAMAASAMCFGSPALAETDTGANDFAKLFHGAPKYKDENGNWLKLRGRVYWDFAALNETPTGGVKREINDNEFRAARLGIQGKYGDFAYVGELDFAGGKTTFKDVNIAWKGPVTVKVGQMKTTNSMEEITSSRHIAFMERGMVTDAFGLDRRVGGVVAKSGSNYGLAAGVFGSSINASQDGTAGTTVFSARGSFAPIHEKRRMVHLGASVRYTDDSLGAPKHSARWGAHLASEKVKPGIGGDAFLFGLEAATVFGSFHGHAEYMQEDGNLGSASGGFVQAGYFLTGEARKYKVGSGKFDRTKPARSLSEGGFGGWELVARYDTLDATSAGDEKVDAWTAGITWYPESHLRVKVNYTDADGDRFVADGLQLRLQVDW
jgi:phosphate-selective porin OprO/OprP